MTHHVDLAVEAELRHRRTALHHDAEQHRLARLAGRAARAAAVRLRPARGAHPVPGHPVPGHPVPGHALPRVTGGRGSRGVAAQAGPSVGLGRSGAGGPSAVTSAGGSARVPEPSVATAT